MIITKLKFTSVEENSIQVSTENSSYSTTWPCYTWHAEAIQDAINSGMVIEPWKTDLELEQEVKQTRISEIDLRLLEIDTLSIRPLRAIQSGTSTQFDIDKLSELDVEASALRVEKKALSV